MQRTGKLHPDKPTFLAPGVDIGRDVGNGVNRGHVDVVVDDRGMLAQEPKQPKHHSTCKRNAK